jgi:hypothetical protein|tara:strand:- start:412 stop:627 length:216 start_codon:yes stop_codon:yes gene_type:complete
MVKLKKIKNAQWLGNGMGTDKAQWCVKGAEHIMVYNLGCAWIAKNTNDNSQICRSWEKATLLIKLQKKGIV